MSIWPEDTQPGHPSSITSCSPCPVEEPELADSHPLPESWAKLGARKCVVFAPLLCQGPQPFSSLSSEILTSLHVGRPRWSVAGQAEPAEGPMRGGGAVSPQAKNTQTHTGTCTCFPMGMQPSSCPTPQPAPPQHQLSQETWMGRGLRNWHATTAGLHQESKEPQLVFCGQSLRLLLITADQVPPAPPENPGEELAAADGAGERGLTARSQRQQRAESTQTARDTRRGVTQTPNRASWRREVGRRAAGMRRSRWGGEGSRCRLAIPGMAKPPLGSCGILASTPG